MATARPAPPPELGALMGLYNGCDLHVLSPRIVAIELEMPIDKVRSAFETAEQHGYVEALEPDAFAVTDAGRRMQSSS